MAESFSDLWASSNPVKSQQAPPKKLGTVTRSTSSVNLNTPPDAFSLLASAASSRPSSRPITPSSIKLPPATSKNGTSSTEDAFGGLVSFGGPTSHDDGLTIAERAAKAERERKQAAKDPAVNSLNSSVNPPPSNDTWNFDFLISERRPSPSYQVRRPDKPTSESQNTWDLDFISSEPPIPIISQGEADDDILGSLAQPVGAVRGISPQPSHKPPSPVPLTQSSSRTSPGSPPPHVLGKIVEMGFSVQQAKVALAATSTGVDVEAAMEFLLERKATSSPEGEEANDPPARIDRTSRQQNRDLPHARGISNHQSPSPQHPESSSGHQEGVQEHTDYLLSQASTIGMTMFNKANAFLKDSRDKLVKAYEEQRSKNVSVDGGPGKGRPRWMDDAMVRDGAHDDSLDDSYNQQPHKNQPHAQQGRSSPDPIQHQTPSLLLVDESPAYRSPARRRPPKSASTFKTPSPIPVQEASNPIVRHTIDASPSVVATSGSHKTAGTEHFKLGRFVEAEAAYSRAIDALPDSHMLRIPLYNNRALTRLKTGDYNGAIDDTSVVLHIITGDLGTAWHPGREAPGGDENLGDAVGKAIRRRAEAYEGLEKWKEAASDWERLSATQWIGQALRRNAMNGAGRCRRLTASGNGQPSSSTFSEPKRLPTRTQTSAAVDPGRMSDALLRVRAATTAQEKEDQARHDLKDIVDARLLAWRAGKETNIRALIASLDVVLSPTFRWQKVGMAELVSAGQVKAHYTKAIARLHPDKLNVHNTTLEERMVANGVFGSLNEAWNASR